MLKNITLLFLILFVSAPMTFAQSAQPTTQTAAADLKLVKAIEIQGNKTISIATVLSKIKTRVGQEYRQSIISDDLKRLYNTGYFADVRVDRQEFEGGFKVIIYVDEKAVIEEITFSKTRHFNSKKLSNKLKSQVGKFLDNKSVKDDEQTIKELYTKKGLTSATVKVETFIDEVTNKASLHFIIREGFKVKIKKINIYGNDSFKDRKIRRVIKSRKKAIFRSGYLSEELLDEDMDRIRAFYEHEGYIDAVAEYNIEYLYKGQIEVNIEIAEGRRYHVGDVSIIGNDIISKKEIENIMEEVNKGSIFSRERLSVDLQNIRTLYFDRGYIFAQVNEATSLDPKTGEVEVKIDITEGGLAYIEKVTIQGNTRTRDVVIRRELKMFPGDRFDGANLRKSKQRLEDLRYFEDVSFDIEDTNTPDRKNLVVQVKEAKTGTFSFGGGFSTVDRVVGFIEVEQRNFDWRKWPTFTGGGQQLSVRAETGSSRNNYRLSFTEPWMFDRPISGGFDIYRSDRDRENDTGYAYDEERTGGVLRLGKRFTDKISGGVSYKFEEVTIENFESGVSAALLAEGGTNTVSSLGFTVSRDSRDSVISPTKGLVTTFSTDFAGGILGADKDFWRTQINSKYYIPLKWKSVLELRARGGIVNDYGDSTSVPIFERFFAGGSRSIRGYDERGVGPTDAVNGDPIGGESIFVANIEYTIPLIDFVKFATFLDTGNVWADAGDIFSDKLFTGAGVGLRVRTPVGPISLDYGYPLNDPPGGEEQEGQFYFSVSRGF